MKSRVLSLSLTAVIGLVLLSTFLVTAKGAEDPVHFEGTTATGGRVSIRTASDYSVVTQVAISRCFSCGGHSSCGVVTATRALGEAWPIVNRSFHINDSADDEELLRFEIAGTFDAGYSEVAGTYQGVIILCSGWPGPCWEECRGPEREWSATRVTDSTPPNVPSNPSPVDGATGVSTDADLSWTGGDPDPADTVTYDVYLGAGDSEPDNLVCEREDEPYCDPGPLAHGTQYFWYVLATDNHGAKSTGDTWDFTTAAYHGVRTWDGSVSSDWHNADNWTPSGVPSSADDVTIPDVLNDPVISNRDAAVDSLAIEEGAVLDLTRRALTVEGVLTNDGALSQTRGVGEGTATNFLRITNMAGTETKYYGVDITPSSLVSTEDTSTVSKSGVDPAAKLQSRGVTGASQFSSLELMGAPASPPMEEASEAAEGSRTFFSIADASLLQGAPSFNDGSDLDMWVGYEHCNEDFIGIVRGLARFDVSSIPAGSSIQEATLRVHLVSNCDIGERTHEVTVHRSSTSWSESSVTWNTQPDFAESYGSTWVPSETWAWYSFDVTDLVRGWAEGDFANYGLMLRGPESSGNDSARLGFSTKEGDYPPQLVVEWADNAPPNEPSAPSPADGATEVATGADLSWTGGDPDAEDSVTYEVYFGTSASPDLKETIGPYPATQSVITYDPGTLSSGTQYHWYVVAIDEQEVSTTGDLWDFTTRMEDNEPPNISGLPDQELPMNGSANDVIDLWAFSSDAEDADAELTFTISNSPAPGAGVTIDGNRYVDINPVTGWTGTTEVEIQVEDTGGLTDSDRFQVSVEGTDVTVSVSGSQFCAGRDTGVKRCFDIEPEGEMDATVRFYFAEAERNGQTLEDLLVFHDNGGWTEEPGPYTRGGVGDAQYVQAQDVDDFSLFALDTAGGGLVYLPLVAKHYPPIPDVPVLSVIDNPDGDGDYRVSWSPVDLADTYTLQEDDNKDFSSPTECYSGSNTYWDASGKAPGTYFYQVKATNLWKGEQLDSGWSNIRSVTVTPPPMTLYLHIRDGTPGYFLNTNMDDGDYTFTGLPGATEWVMTLKQDLVGTDYTYSIHARTYGGDVTCDVEILLRRDGTDTVLASWPQAFTARDGEFTRYTGATTGVDPHAQAGDTLVLRIRPRDGTAFVFCGSSYGTTGYSHIDVPGYIPMSSK